MSNRKGTYFEIDELRKRVEELENKLDIFMEKWGPTYKKRGTNEIKFGMR